MFLAGYGVYMLRVGSVTCGLCARRFKIPAAVTQLSCASIYRRLLVKPTLKPHFAVHQPSTSSQLHRWSSASTSLKGVAHLDLPSAKV